MKTSVTEHPTQCRRCAAPLDYRLGVNEGSGGGFRYEVFCSLCHHTYYELTAPLFQLSTAA